MRGVLQWLTGVASCLLAPGEREAVHGDLAESGESGIAALRDVLGLVARRQAALWTDWRPWLALVGLVFPVGVLLSLSVRNLDSSYALHLWILRNRKDIDAGTLTQLGIASPGHGVLLLACGSLLLALWSWSNGVVLGSLARRSVWVNGTLFCFILFYLGMPVKHRYRYDVEGGLFPLSFYNVMLPLILQMLFILLPSVQGMRQGRAREMRPVARAMLWAAAIVTALVIRGWFWWPFRSSWQMQLLLIAVYRPIGYLVTTAIQRRGRRSERPNQVLS
jgi:hypothetical protein